MKKQSTVTPDTIGTPVRKITGSNLDTRGQQVDDSWNSSAIDISDSESIDDFCIEFDLCEVNPVLIPASNSVDDSFDNQNSKIRDLLYQEIRTSSHIPKKNKFMHDQKFLFLRDSFLSYSKTQVNRLGKQLAKALNINTIKSEVKWVQDFKYMDTLFYTGFLINSSREGFGRVSFKKLDEVGGVKYEGVFKNNGCNSESSKIYYETGKIMFEGKMVEGVREGFGRLYWDTGKIAYSGIWKYNNPAGELIEVFNPKGVNIYKGKSKGGSIDDYFKLGKNK